MIPTRPPKTAPAAITPRSTFVPAPAAEVDPEPVELADVAVAEAALPVKVVVLVTSPLTASATCARPVETMTLPSVAVTLSVTVVLRVLQVQPWPQSPQPPQPASSPSPPGPIHGLPSHGQPVTVTTLAV